MPWHSTSSSFVTLTDLSLHHGTTWRSADCSFFSLTWFLPLELGTLEL
ncbi:hypothetical protein MTR67_023222 [Solanum verrucosum]|uniref:Uncharacterized protein n=1 Tax=Solanum verrucosum TaxID=315347 RepID=A0AAF0QWC9_SOLVR|nr:hypothetical protein MTR67_023222 [Solanum verrucosum]